MKKQQKTPPKQCFPMMISVRAVLSMCMVVAMTAAMFTMLAVLVTVLAFAAIRIRHERPREMPLHSLIRIPLHARDELDARLGKRRLCTRTDAAADDEIRLRCVKERRKRAMPLADRVHNLLSHIGCNIVELKLLRPAEMLLDLTVCIWYCNSHCMLSFFFHTGHCRLLDLIHAPRNADALPADDFVR